MKINQNIENYLNEYIKSTNPGFAVMLNGDWGIGKTFFIKLLIEKWSRETIEKGKYISLKPLYISLNGITTLNQINTKINEAIYPILQSKGAKFFKKLGKGVVKGILKIDTTDSSEITMEIDVLSLFKSDQNNIKGNRILIFDDLERCKLTMTETLGYINDLSEHHSCNVIILADENQIKDEKYPIIKEKTIGKNISFTIRPK